MGQREKSGILENSPTYSSRRRGNGRTGREDAGEKHNRTSDNELKRETQERNGNHEASVAKSHRRGAIRSR